MSSTCRDGAVARRRQFDLRAVRRIHTRCYNLLRRLPKRTARVYQAEHYCTNGPPLATYQACQSSEVASKRLPDCPSARPQLYGESSTYASLRCELMKPGHVLWNIESFVP